MIIVLFVLGAVAFLGVVIAAAGAKSSREEAWALITGELVSARMEETHLTAGTRYTFIVTIRTDDGRLLEFTDPPGRTHVVGERIERGVVVSRPPSAPPRVKSSDELRQPKDGGTAGHSDANEGRQARTPPDT